MRAAAVLREAARDVGTGTSKLLLYFLVYLAVLGLLTAHEVSSVAAVIDAAQKFQQAGANVRIVSSAGRVDGAACVALADNYDVTAAAVRQLPGQFRATTMRSVPLSQYVATPGIEQVLGVERPGGGAGGAGGSDTGVFVGSQVLDQFGEGLQTLPGEPDELVIAGVFPYPDDGRMAGYGFAVVMPEPTSSEPYDECWVKSWPELPEVNGLLHSVVIPADKPDAPSPDLSQLNTTLGRTFDGAAMFSSRMSRFDPYLALIAGAAIGVFAVRSRRLELASAQHAGVGRGALTRMQLLQQSVWVVLASGVTFGATAVFAGYYPDDVGSLLGIAARVIGLGAAGALAGVVVATVTIRERALFIYFKQRE
ncbi:hypothetical protein ICL81_03275 [Leucobacter sp. cx-328]|uniref:hypothetical protein n=1 Tax=unclassified Leucobacter TaxID=2621730 RepID=UPI00165DDE29|nr:MULTISPECIES: hypothetical protein [unclassified Leucobacter]MBC9943548.1 hypothetical protein [Leucobacter sp. cx-328]